MKHLYKYGLIIFIIFSLNENVYSKESIPDWINNSKKYCSLNEYCAIGYGKDAKQADFDASFKLLKEFSQYSDTMEDTTISTIDKDVSETVQASANIILKKIRIMQQFTSKDITYSFAILNKVELSKHIKEKIDDMDKEIKSLLSSNKINVKQFEILYKLRNNLNRKYKYITNNSIAFSFTNEEIINKIQENKLKFYVKSSDHRIKNIIEKFIKESYNIVVNDNINYDRVINAKIQISENTSKISTILDYSVVLIIQVKDIKGKLINTVHNTFMIKAVNNDDFLNQLLGQIDLYLKENYYSFIQ